MTRTPTETPGLAMNYARGMRLVLRARAGPHNPEVEPSFTGTTGALQLTVPNLSAWSERSERHSRNSPHQIKSIPGGRGKVWLSSAQGGAKLHGHHPLQPMDEGQAQGEEPVRRSGQEADLLYDHAHIPTLGTLSPDQNQNRLMEDEEEAGHGTQGRSRLLQQDSVNNNGGCEDEEDDEESSKVEEEDSSKVGEEEEGDSYSGALSPDLDSQSRDSSSYSPTGVEELVSSPEECVLGGVEDHVEGDAARLRGGPAPCAPPATALDLGEHLDHALLPQRLHQIAEALVLEEDYERAIRFVQLERVYHERLLANLAALQEHWELRWRGAGGPQRQAAERTPIDPEQLERLSHICRTHQQPLLSAEQCKAADKVQLNSQICRRTEEEEEEEEVEVGRALAPLLPCDAGSMAESARAMEQERDTREAFTQHDYPTANQQRAPESSQPCPSPTASPHLPTETLTGSSGLADGPSSNGCAAEAGLEAGPFAAAAAEAEAGLAGGTEGDGRQAEDFPEAPAATGASRSPSREGPGEERQAPLPLRQPHTHSHTHTQPSQQHMEPLPHATHTPDEPISHTTLTRTHTPREQIQAQAAELRPSQPEVRTAGDGEEEDEELEEEEEEEVEEAEEALELDGRVGVGGGGRGVGEDGGLVDLGVPEESPEYEEGDRGQRRGLGGDTVEPFKVATLDDMAKRIQVEEITPASGLVSILKRRSSLEGSSAARPIPKLKAPTKRKVRFREPDDAFDQDEVGGDSWLLLLLLCLATVVISVGGTALYCTVGDAQSSVCTDFSHNMDFYIGQLQRGVAELQHWFSPSSS
ncbi:hypothetical protein ACEWY4_005050 [Coilia grayii]|uniref:Consortin C-terminal domain-containing protein n=1 Tax=Coilia grayii TaxID=363190 RepID=A0ABD1KHJ5_9TELE